MEIKEYIKVMQSFEKGEAIEYRSKVRGGAWTKWKEMTQNMGFHFGEDINGMEYEYRIKETHRPYTVDEFVKAMRLHGPMIKVVNTKFKIHEGCYVLPSLANDTKIIFEYKCWSKNNKLENFSTTYKDLLDHCVWADGTPCGILELNF